MYLYHFRSTLVGEVTKGNILCFEGISVSTNVLREKITVVLIELQTNSFLANEICQNNDRFDWELGKRTMTDYKLFPQANRVRLISVVCGNYYIDFLAMTYHDLALFEIFHHK